jgi:hypothetical protein
MTEGRSKQEQDEKMEKKFLRGKQNNLGTISQPLREISAE